MSLAQFPYQIINTCTDICGNILSKIQFLQEYGKMFFAHNIYNTMWRLWLDGKHIYLPVVLHV